MRRAERMGVPWRRNVDALRGRLAELEQRRRSLVDDALAYPAYYISAPFHTYREGNLAWTPAFEVESSALAVHARVFSTVEAAAAAAATAATADPMRGDRRLRDSYLEVVRAYAPAEAFAWRQRAGSDNDGGGDGGGMRVLDIGCSTGLSTFHLAEWLCASAVTHPPSVLGIDLSPYMLAVASWRADEQQREHAARIRFVHAAAERIRQPDASFDWATCTLVMHELPAAATCAMFAEAYRVLRAGALFSLMDADPHAEAFRRLPAAAAVIFRSTEPYFAEYERVDVARLLQRAGFELLGAASNTARHRTWVARKPTAPR